VKKVRKRTPPRRRTGSRTKRRKAVAAVPVTAAELRALRDEFERRLKTPNAVAVGKQRTSVKSRKRGATPLRWNPQPEDVQKSVAQLVLTLVEFLRKLMERQAIRRMQDRTLTRQEVEAVGTALMLLEQTVRDIGEKFGLTPEDLNLDLGAIKLM
jgi:gas vesicle protein GvpK